MIEQFKTISEKSIISILNEIMSSKKQDSMRGYEQTSDFTYCANSYGELIGFDSKSEEEVKNNAAIDFLEEMDRSGAIYTTSNILPTSLIDQSEVPTKEINSEIEPPSTLILLKLCCERRWKLPVYEFYLEKNPIDENSYWYTARCIVKDNHITGFGSGRNKREATINAATDFCKKLDSSSGIDTINSSTINFLPIPLIKQREEPMEKILNFKCELNSTTAIHFCEKINSSDGIDNNNNTSSNILLTPLIDQKEESMKIILNSKCELNSSADGDFCETMDNSGGVNTNNLTTSNILPTSLIDQREDPMKKMIHFKCELNSTVFFRELCNFYHLGKPDYVCCPNSFYKDGTEFIAMCNTQSLQDITGLGSGESKKQAKNNAATDFLQNMYISGGINTINSTTSNVLLNPVISQSKKRTDIIKSFQIRMLHNFCQQRGWKLPNYKFYLEENDPKKPPWYSVICSLYNYHTSGEGSNKKTAKNNAAFQMLFFFMNLALDKIIAPNNRKYPTPINAMLNKSLTDVNKTVRVKKLELSDIPISAKIFHSRGEKSNKFGFYRLMELNLEDKFNICAVDILDQIGIEEGFEAKYVPNTSVLDLISVIVEVAITSLPHLIYVSMGNTLKEAQENAAFVVLMYLKSLLNIFSKK